MYIAPVPARQADRPPYHHQDLQQSGSMYWDAVTQPAPLYDPYTDATSRPLEARANGCRHFFRNGMTCEECTERPAAGHIRSSTKCFTANSWSESSAWVAAY